MPQEFYHLTFGLLYSDEVRTQTPAAGATTYLESITSVEPMLASAPFASLSFKFCFWVFDFARNYLSLNEYLQVIFWV